MFSRSRKKIILSIMTSLVILFVATLSVIMFASYREMRRRNSEILERYADLYFLEPENTNETESGTAGAAETDEPSVPEGQMAPGGPDESGGQNGHGRGMNPGKPPFDENPDYRLSTFYSVAFSEDGTVLSVENGGNELYEEEELTSIARGLMEKNESSGKVDSLSYIVRSKPGYTLVAFMDNTVTDSSLNMLLHNILIVGGAAIVVLFFISLYLSKRIIQPLEENDRKQKQFISDASHELKTPVAVIGTNAEMLSREVGENEWLANIQYENERMGELVRQLLELSRAENAGAAMEPLDFSRIVTGETLAFESLAFDKGKTIESDIEENIRVTGSANQLTQLISVLLDNAVRHSAGSGIEVSLKRQGGSAVLSVINESEEIPPEKLMHLFDRFYRVDEARSGDGHHYGLGLSIAKAVAEKHGGSIHAACEDGKIRFTVTIPEK